MARWFPKARWLSRHSLFFVETLNGTHRSPSDGEDSEERKLAFTLDAASENLLDVLASPMHEVRRLHVEGMVHAEGLADWNGLEGALEIDLSASQRLRYHFDFVGDDGCKYRFEGVKNFTLWHPWQSMTRLYGKIIRREDHSIISTGTVYFDAVQLLPFLLTFRIRNGEGISGTAPEEAGRLSSVQ